MQLSAIEQRLTAIDQGLAVLAAQTNEKFGQFVAAFNHLYSSQFERAREQRFAAIQADDQLRDLIEALVLPHIRPLNWVFATERPVAIDSVDHMHPRGTVLDNTRHPRFVERCEELFCGSIRHLDVGCSGGGMVWEFTRKGHQSVGVEGSDRSRLLRRAEWRTIPDRLFTGDIRYPFSFTDADRPVKFDVISAWELLEHITEAELPALMANFDRNLSERGIIAASIFSEDDRDAQQNVSWHPTLQTREWWIAKFAEHGFVLAQEGWRTDDFARGINNPRTLADWNVRQTPDEGFHIVFARRR